MAVTMMVHFDSEAAFQAAIEAGRKIRIVRDYPGHEEGVRHGRACPHCGKARQGTDKDFTAECVRTVYVDDPDRKPYKREVVADPFTGLPKLENDQPIPFEGKCGDDRCCKLGPLYMETTYEGRVLDTGEMNYRDDSDFYAVVWDGERVKRVEYATTRGWSYPNGASVDATPETREAASEYLRKQARERYILSAQEEAQTPKLGRRVVVTQGKHQGACGVVFYCQERRSRYGTWSYGTRLGISPSGVKTGKLYADAIWVDAANVAVVHPVSYLPADLNERADYHADSVSRNWRGMTAAGLPVF